MSVNGIENGTVPVSSLTEEEVKAINETWSLVWSDKKKNGIDLFLKLFTKYPESKRKFRDFNGLSIDDVRGHKKLRAHALSVMYALKSFVDNFDDMETLDALIRKNAKNHAERGVGEKEIQWIIPVFVELLQDNMGDKLTELHTNSWTKLFGMIATISAEEQESLRNEI